MRIHRSAGMIASLAGVAIMAAFATSGCGNNSANGEVSAAASLASANGSTDLTGTWVYNEDLSDHPRRPDSSGRPDGWRRGDGRRERRPRHDSLHEGRHPRGPLTFVIEQTDSTVAITGPREHTRTLYTDGRVITRQRDDDSAGGQVSASWNTDGQLVVTRTGPKGGARTETFSLSANGQQLIIATFVDPAGDRGARDFRRVFDAAPAGN